jgi:crotonobetainyl-CoA:carnitine CoA-transferase CaiB-like acyl-CoA transferase
MAGGALNGVKVLDLASLFPAPLLAAMLGDLGADVVKIEPPYGDALRRVGVMRDGEAAAWALAGRNKRSVVLDLATTEGIDRLVALTNVADVVVVNQPASMLEQWHCSYDELHARNPHAVVVAMSAFGASGPLASTGGNGTIAEAFGGFAHLNGAADGPPVLPSLALGDTLAAISGLNGVLAALYARDVSGGDGDYVDVAMYESVLSLLGTTLAAWDGGAPAPRRAGSRIKGVAPRNVYRTADGVWVAVSGVTAAQVARVLTIVGASSAGSADELDALVAAWIAAHDFAEVSAAFVGARVPLARINDLSDLVANDHVHARESIVHVTQPNGTVVAMPASVPKLGSVQRAAVMSGAPELGAHTDEVLREWLRPGGY